MIDLAAKARSLDRGMLHRTLPFALFMSFVGLEEGLRLAAQQRLIAMPEPLLCAIYPVKALAVAALLYLWRDGYRELRFTDLRDLKVSAAVAGAGLLTFFLWINLPLTLPGAAAPAGFDPTLFAAGAPRLFMTAARAAGAVLVVPVMEELFWRSFLLRYLVHPRFESVPIGSFSWSSLLIAALLFGLEHHFFLAGVAAGIVYSLVLYRTRSIAQCVLAHAVTNLALALYVLHTGNWRFW